MDVIHEREDHGERMIHYVYIQIASHLLRELGTSLVSNASSDLGSNYRDTCYALVVNLFSFTESLPAVPTSGTLSEEAGSQ